MTAIACASPQELSEFVLGTLSDARMETLAEHTEKCPACQQRLDRLDKISDPLLKSLRRAGQSMTDAVAPRDPPDAPADDLEAIRRRWRPPDHPDELGRLGKYVVHRVLGAGGMGIVFAGEDEVLKRPVAIKVMLPSLWNDRNCKARFLREARAAAAIDDDHVVTIFGAEEDAGMPFIAMPLLKGQTLEDRLRSAPPLTIAEVVDFGRQIAFGLAAAHRRGLVHRDVKPSNVWLEPSDKAGAASKIRVKLLDFGLVRDAGDDEHTTRSGFVLGTPAYLSPEQANGETLDGRSDLFSLGVVLYRLTTGKLPFVGANVMSTLLSLTSHEPPPPRRVNPAIPPALSDLITCLLAKMPKGRPADANSVAAELTRIEQELAEPSVMLESPGNPPRRRTAVILAVTFIAITALVVGAVLRNRTADPPKIADKEPLPVVPIGVASPPSFAAEPWQKLFNGKDLTGWKTNPDLPGDWKVVDGVIVGAGDKSLLFTERGDIGDFHLRLDAKINPDGDSGVFFWTPFEFDGRRNPLEWHEANISARLRTNQTGALNGQQLEASVTAKSPVSQWFTFDVIAVGPHVTTFVNGEPRAELTFPIAKTGHLALQVYADNVIATTVSFRNVKLKTPRKNTIIPSTPTAWQPLFNGKDLTGWAPRARGTWEVVDAVLTGRGAKGEFGFLDLLNPNGKGIREFGDLELEAEVRLTGKGNSGLYFRDLYQAEIGDGQTGSISRGGEHFKWLALKRNNLSDSGWFELNVTAVGNRLTTKVNGVKIADVLDPSAVKGPVRIELDCRNGPATVEFRSLKVRDLSAAGK